MEKIISKLKPCPFCGGNSWTVGAPFMLMSIDREHIIHCTKCGTQIIPKAVQWKEAIEAVNMRATDKGGANMPTIPEIVEEVKMEICDHYCKYPNMWDEEKEGTTLEEGKCTGCPLGRLG